VTVAAFWSGAVPPETTLAVTRVAKIGGVAELSATYGAGVEPPIRRTWSA
jgi:hypothetical protein